MSDNIERKPENMEGIEKKAAPKKKKKRRKAKVSLRFAALMIAVAMIFGIIVGYAVGRATATARLSAADRRIDELTLFTEEAGREEIDVFTDSISAENRAALADLSGMSMEAAGDNVFLGLEEEEGFTGLYESALSEPVAVVEFNGGQVMSDEVSREYNDRLAGYIFSGYTEEQVAAKLLDEVIHDLAEERILQAKAQEMGLLTLTPADTQQIAAQAQAEYQEQLDACKGFVYQEGMSEADLTAAAQAFLLESSGVDYEGVRSEIESGWWMQKLRDELTRNVQLDSSAIMKTYNARLDAQKAAFTADAAAFETAQQKGEVILYNLSGYRAVKPIIIRMEDGLAGEAAQLQAALANAGEQAEEIRARLDECYATAEAEAREALDRLNAGINFDSVLSQYGDDAGMKTEPLRTTGYYVKQGSAALPEAVVSAAMEMTAAGQISDIIRIENGVCILQYAGEVRGGEVDVATVYDSITADARTEAGDSIYESKISAWMEAADVKYYPERMQ